jgi:NADH-quinone oxidoreductase subunit G
VLSVRERGNLNEIVVAPGRQLDHKYTLMTEYVCPVGALTAVDFRFKARVWFLRSAPTVCTGCATGCNAYTDFDPRTQKVHRYRPRENLAVNKYWMCDDGMLDYQRITEGRLLKARIKREETTRAAALSRAAELLRGKNPAKVAIVLSAEHSQEDNAALLWLGREVVGTTQVFVSGRPEGAGDEILISSDKNPNSAGVAELVDRVPLRSFSEFEATVADNALDLVIALGSQVPLESSAPSRLNSLIALASHDGPWAKAASVLLPASSWAESDGTFVNADGLTQESEKAVNPMGDSAPAWRLVAELAKELDKAPGWKRPEDVRVSLSKIARTTSSPPAPSAGANG